MRLQELPLVALQPQEPLVFGTPGFPLRSGLKKKKKSVVETNSTTDFTFIIPQ